MEEAIVPEIYNPALLDEKINVFDEDVLPWPKTGQGRGNLFGMSAGAAFHVAGNSLKTG